MDCILEINKNLSSNEAIIGDILTFTVSIKNISEYRIDEVLIKDILPQELKFILGSVKINYKEDNYSNVISGIKLININPGTTNILTYEVEIIDKFSDYILNKSMAEYKYFKKNEKQYGYVCSNEESILVKNPNIGIYKESDRKNVTLGEEINYTITIVNEGDIDLKNIMLVEYIPENVKLIDGSFSINGNIINSVELKKGISLDNLEVNKKHVVKYTLKVDSGGNKGEIVSKSNVNYSYSLPSGITFFKTSKENVITVSMNISNFKQISIDEYITLPLKNNGIQEINNIKVDVKITKFNTIKTSIAESLEGQGLSGYKVIIHGILAHAIEYTSDTMAQTVHLTEYTSQFSTYIVLPKNFNFGDTIEIDSSIEDIYFKAIDKRSFYVNKTILLTVKSVGLNKSL